MTEAIKNKGIKGLLKIKGEPKGIARGFALGSFIGMLPFPGFQMLISASVATVLRVNKTAAIAGVFNTNLATGAFVFAFNYWLGRKILGIESSFQIPKHIGFSFTGTVLKAGSDVFLSMLLGGVVTGIIAMIAGYYISFFILKKIQRKRHET